MTKLQRISGWKMRLVLGVAVCAAMMVGTSVRPGLIPASTSKAAPSSTDLGKVKAGGAFTADFALPANTPPNIVAPLIERDRMYMAARRGMQNKYLPLKFEAGTGNLLSGGRYLFDTEHDAEQYKDWVENDFILDGMHFFARPFFINPDFHSWKVIDAHHLDELAKRVIVRTERWSVPINNQVDTLKQKWDGILDEARTRGLTSVWLLYNAEERLVQLVYFANRTSQQGSTPYDAGLTALESSNPLGHHFDDQAWTKTFDRTQWVLTIWFPFVTGDNGEPSLWPHSPPFPSPICGDGVCEVSRGETNANCPGDCPPTAGNGKCEPGENTMNCPGDCPPQ